MFSFVFNKVNFFNLTIISLYQVFLKTPLSFIIVVKQLFITTHLDNFLVLRYAMSISISVSIAFISVKP